MASAAAWAVFFSSASAVIFLYCCVFCHEGLREFVFVPNRLLLLALPTFVGLGQTLLHALAACL